MKDEFMLTIMMTVESADILLRVLSEHRIGSIDDDWVNAFIQHVEAHKLEATR
jgi:hypothetical protein